MSWLKDSWNPEGFFRDSEASHGAVLRILGIFEGFFERFQKIWRDFDFQGISMSRLKDS